ncbi:hypothetical protein EST38_g12635 [Candolleomyces aberdarensis]|uniref:Uncharacterized protein n=1 Tax=Candolleomyces aberdarensis TaxID=2316362 RepID=A0A4Q2D327_9AGAR|nr:hypothetical protein EST38_g12635 [Candolleomyces aberdarensis]
MKKVGDVYNVTDVASLAGTSFSAYAKRVQILEISERMDLKAEIKVDSSVYLHVSEVLGGAPLLPSLHSIRLLTTTTTFPPGLAIRLLLPCPALQAVQIAGSALDSPWFYQIGLPLLASRARSIKHLALSHDTAKIPPLLWSTMLSFPELDKLDIRLPQSNSVPGQFLTQLGTRANRLLDLNLHVPLDRLANVEFNQAGYRTLRRVNEVSIANADESLYPNLDSLSVLYSSELRLLQCVSGASAARHITSLTLHISPISISNLPQTAHTLAACRHLKRVTLKETQPETSIGTDGVLRFMGALKLEDFVIDVSRLKVDDYSQNCLSTADGSLENILRGREGLRSLVLPCKWLDTSASLNSLVSIPRVAPSMRCVGLAIDSSLTSHADELPKLISSTSLLRSSQSSELVELEICDVRAPSNPFSPFEYQAIAQFIDTCFPKLTSIRLHPTSTFRDFWTCVEQLRIVYKEMRLLSSRLTRN